MDKGKFEGRFGIYSDIIRKCLLNAQKVFVENIINAMHNIFRSIHIIIDNTADYMKQCKFEDLKNHVTRGFLGGIPRKEARTAQNFRAQKEE